MIEQMECSTCRAIAGDITLTNAPRLDLDEHWLAEHCHPVARRGWIVLILRRHARAIHELTDAESLALGHWLPTLARALHRVTGCESEYVMQFAEGDGFHHVHFHIVARAADWPDEFRGPHVFAAMRTPDPIGSMQATEVILALSEILGLQ
jgi:diadenosine tetraphosphate (Ap4A) HIT family hydrolase